MAQYIDEIKQPASPPNGVHKGKEHISKATRHPRWTREETLVLIEGKKVIEVLAQENRTFELSGHVTTKWDSVSAYCHRHGVNKSTFQCQKRWGNLNCEFKKIKAWESQKMEKDESFWIMRNEKRKERKLPSSFDKEVYNAMEGRFFASRATPLALIKVKEEMNEYSEEPSSAAEKAAENLEDDGNTEIINYKQTRGEYSSFMDFVHHRKDSIGSSSEKKITETENPSYKQATPMHNAGKNRRKFPDLDTWAGPNSKQKSKRKRIALDGYIETDNDLQDQLINVLEENIQMLSAQIQVENTNYEQDRNERKDQNDNLIKVLNKLTDAVVKIADKLSETT